MKRILIVAYTYSNGGGGEKVLHTLIGELSKWYEIDLIERWEDDTYVYELPQNVRKLKSMTYFPHMVETHGWNKLYWILHRKILSILTILFPQFVYRYYIKDNYDYEISFNYLYPALLIANSPNKRSKKIAWNHGDLYNLDYRKFKGFHRVVQWVKYNMEKRALQKIDIVVAISQNTKNSINQIFPFVQDKLHIIYNGYDFDSIVKKSHLEDIGKSTRFRIISLGRLDQNKNVIMQVQAVNKLVNGGFTNIELLIFGQGVEENKLRQEAGDNLDKYIFIKGFSKNPYPYLRTSDVLLMTSFSEGFPTVLIEAICLGVPVITTPVGGVDEIVRNGVNGLVVENNVDKIAEGIYYIANHYDNFNNHIEYTISQFTAEHWGQMVKNILEEK